VNLAIIHQGVRRGGRVVEGAALEKQYARKGIEVKNASRHFARPEPRRWRGGVDQFAPRQIWVTRIPRQ